MDVRMHGRVNSIDFFSPTRWLFLVFLRRAFWQVWGDRSLWFWFCMICMLYMSDTCAMVEHHPIQPISYPLHDLASYPVHSQKDREQIHFYWVATNHYATNFTCVLCTRHNCVHYLLTYYFICVSLGVLRFERLSC